MLRTRLSICAYAQATTSYRQDYKDMALELAAIATFLAEHMDDRRSKRMSTAITSISEYVISPSKSNDNITNKNCRTLSKEIERISKRQNCSGPGRLAKTMRDEENLVKDYRRVKGLFLQLQVSTINSSSRRNCD